MTLTVDQRLQDFAAAQLGGDVGAVVALDPQTGAILAIISTPTFDPTPISGDPATAGDAMAQISAGANNPLVDRTRQGRYTPGSVMKVLTAAAALDAGAITPQTTFADQPSEETEGFVVEGFRVLEHDLGNVAAGALVALPGAAGLEQHLLRARRPRARRRPLPRLCPPRRLL